MGKRIGDPADPLLVSVRSGAKFSMPGMMDTVLNLGLNDQSVEGLAKQTDDERFAYDSYRRFVAMYGRIVLGIAGEEFDALLDAARELAGASSDAGIPTELLRYLVGSYQQIVERHTSRPFPQDPDDQLRGAIEAVFASWNGPRAIAYRVREQIPHDLGTAVNVQAMVFGNRDDNSGTGVGFTRDPATGANGEYGDFLVNAQGEDVVAGIRNTETLADLAQHFPAIHRELLDIFARLEAHYRDMCDTEFTIEQGKLWMLQTRVGKRTGRAALKMAVDMVSEPAIALTRTEALGRITGDHLEQVLHPQFAGDVHTVLAKGLGASPGAAVGRVYLTADDALAASQRGEQVVLVRSETSPEDVHGMLAAEGILTARGGLVSHAAVVARGWGKPAVVGAEALRIAGSQFRVGETVVHEGDWISLDGTEGIVVLGKVELSESERPPEFDTVLEWADEVRRGRLGVRANADNGPDAANARRHGAEGIGLCRTEHMFLGEDRLPIVRRMILASSPAEEETALEALREAQRADFVEILEAMDGLPVTVRLLDPPLHEFLPDIQTLAVKEATVGLDEDERALYAGRQGLARVQPDARHPRGPAGGDQAGSLRDAGTGADGGGPRPTGGGRQPGSRDHDPADREPGGARPRPVLGRSGGGRDDGRRGGRQVGRLAGGPRRYHDRDAPGGAPCRGDRRSRRVLLVRDQRPDPDDLRVQSRRRRGPDDVRLLRGGPARAQPLRGGRPRRGRRAGPPGRDPRTGDPTVAQDRGLRRARRGPRVDRRPSPRRVSTT